MFSSLKEDLNSKKIKMHVNGSYNPSSTRVPIIAKSDGSCFFNSASIFKFGSQEFSMDLRLQTFIKLIASLEFNEKRYKKVFARVARDVIPSALNLLYNDDVTAWPNVQSILSLAHVLSCNVVSI